METISSFGIAGPDKKRHALCGLKKADSGGAPGCNSDFWLVAPTLVL